MINRRRDEIEKFCSNSLHCNNHQLHELINNYRHMLAQIDIQQMQFTKDTFDSSFQGICNKVFTHRPTSNGYIIVILGFAVAINNYHRTSSWYTIDILMNSLINVLEEIDFHLEQLTTTSCILL